MTKQNVYLQKSPLNCGPATAINLFGIKGNKKLEYKLANVGKIKPYQISLGESFFKYSKEFHKKVEVFSLGKGINKKMFDLMNYYEKIPKEKQGKFKEKVLKNLDKINLKNKSNIHHFSIDPIKKLILLLDKYNKVGMIVSSEYRHGQEIPHWVTVYGENKKGFMIMDSESPKTKGIITLTENQLKKSIKSLNKIGFYVQFVVEVK